MLPERTRRPSRLSLPEAPSAVSFSPDGTRLLVARAASFSLWKVPGLEPIWEVPNPSSVPMTLAWSVDGSTLTVAYDGAGALLLDARTGEALARIIEGHAGSGTSQVDVLPNLRYRVSRGGNSWALFAMPGLDTTSPSEALRRALADGGFRLRGVELEAVLP